MIVINLTIVIGGEVRDSFRIDPGARKIYDEEAQRLEERKRTGHKIICDRCGWTQWYESPGRARMGLSGHQKSCKRAKPSKV